MMSALESMRSVLKPIRIYSLGASAVVDWELQAYAAGLEAAYELLTELKNESFVSNASGYGLTNREKQFGLTGQGAPEDRRAAVLKLGAVTPNNFTKADMEQILEIAGLKAEICENTAANHLYVNCLTENADETARNTAKKAANMFLPAHLGVELDFRSISWNNIDQKDESFDVRDGMDFTWDLIDNYENGMLQI
jgi:hypothetical protein